MGGSSPPRLKMNFDNRNNIGSNSSLKVAQSPIRSDAPTNNNKTKL